MLAIWVRLSVVIVVVISCRAAVACYLDPSVKSCQAA